MDVVGTIDQFGMHRLRFRLRETTGSDELCTLCISIEHDRGDVKSPLDLALRGSLRFQAEAPFGDSFHFPSKASWFEIPVRGSSLSVYLGSNTEPLLRYDLVHQLVVSFWTLSSIESRFLAEFGYPMERPKHCFQPQLATCTDLHTHFAGCVHSEDLVALGIEYGVRYPSALLSKLGASCTGEDVALDHLSPPILQQLIRRMSVPSERRITFSQLELIYELRRPLRKTGGSLFRYVEKLLTIMPRWEAAMSSYR